MQLTEEHAARLATELEMQSRCELCRYAQHGVSRHLPVQKGSLSTFFFFFASGRGI